MYLLRCRQVWILKDKIAVNNSTTRIPEIFLALPNLPEALGVESGGVCKVGRHHVHQHRQPPVSLLGHRQQMAQGPVQGGKPGDMPGKMLKATSNRE